MFVWKTGSVSVCPPIVASSCDRTLDTMSLLPKSLSKTLTAALLALSANAYAQQSSEPDDVGTLEGLGEIEGLGDIEDLSLDSMLGTVTAASRREESVLKAPASVTIFESEDIRRTGAMDIPDLLRHVPGMQVQRYGPNSVTVWLRGVGALESNNVIVMIDGLPISDPFDGSVDWSALPVRLEDVRRIEVVRGPVSTIYGSGAHSGVVDITTWDRDRPPPTSADVGVGIDGNGDFAVVGGARFGSSGAGPLRYQVRADGAYNDLWSRGAAGPLPPAKRANAQGRLWWELAPGSRLLADVGVTFAGRTDLGTILASPDEHRRRVIISSLRYQQEFGGVVPSVEAAFRFARYQLASIESTTAVGRLADADSAQWYASVIARLAFTEWLQGNAGAELYSSWGQAAYLLPDVNDTWRTWSAAYLNLDIDALSNLRFNLATRGDWLTSTGEFQISIRGSAILYNERGSLRLSTLSAFRDPSFLERGISVVSSDGLSGTVRDPNMKAPRNNAIELAGQLLPAPGWSASLVGFFSGGPTVYRLEQPGPDTFGVLGYVRTFGEELQVEWRAPELSVRGTVTFLQFIRPPETEHQIPESSALTASLWVQGTALNRNLSWSLAGSFATGRTYDTLRGLESQPFSAALSPQALATGMVRYRFTGPLAAFAKAQLNVPYDAAQAPYPEAAQQGVLGLVGLEFTP